MKLSEIISIYSSNDRKIYLPYVIAEAGVNHDCNMDLAKRLVEEAAEGGAQAIKFQTYKADTLASKHSPSYWDTSKESITSQHQLFSKYDKFWKKEFEQLKLICDKSNIEFLSTPFDVESSIFLNDLMDVYKISSSDLTNIPFIKFICSFKKPIILSTGASYIWEIQKVVDIIEENKIPLCLMHCILNYPTPDQNANLGMILDLKDKFPHAIPGYSDHTLPKEMEVLKIANLLGAVILEKHFTYDKSLPGNDHYHAMDKEDLKLFWKKMELINVVMGKVKKTALPEENISRINARRSLVANKRISKGEALQNENLTWKRPAYGISPQYFDEVVGKTALCDIEVDTVLQWNMLS